MRRPLAVTIVLAAPGALLAQAPPAAAPPAHTVPTPGAPAAPPPAPAPAPAPAQLDPKLVTHLLGWEKAMKSSKSFYSECVTTKEDKAQLVRYTFKGSVMCLKPGFAKTRLDRQPEVGRPPESVAGISEEYLITDRAVFVYDSTGVDRQTGKPKQKTVTEHKFPPGQAPRNVMLDFLSGSMTAQATINRFHLQLAREEKHYIHINVLPRTAEDAADFSAMTLVLYQPDVPGYGYLPARVRFSTDKFNQQVEDWQFLGPVVDHANVVPAQFVPRQVDATWVREVKNVPAAGAAAVGTPAGRVTAPGGAPAGTARP